MKRLSRRTWLGAVFATALPPALAQVGGGVGGGIGGRRNEGGTINYAPGPAIYEVLAVDADAKTVRLRAASGRTGVVQVGDAVYDLSRLKAGDRIKVDFVVPDEKNPQLRAASVWPAVGAGDARSPPCRRLDRAQGRRTPGRLPWKPQEASMYRHLLVPVDDSDLSVEVVGNAVALARSLGARITFFHAVSDAASLLRGEA
jgi:hypothetical protein